MKQVSPTFRSRRTQGGACKWLLFLVALSLWGWLVPACKESPSRVSQDLQVSDAHALHNLMQVASDIYSGGEPHGEEAFAEIARLGVKTVVSVDGATPNVALARKYGLRYVHAPFGYDGIDEQSALTLAHVMREAEGPFYVHCHHGKHRGPAGAAIMCLVSNQTDHDGARQILERAGTSPDYAGLWRDVAAFEPPPADAVLPPLLEVAPVESLAAAMAVIDRAYDNLKLCRDADWRTPADHPDIVPAREALLIVENLRESARNMPDDHDPQLKTQLTDAEAVAMALETALRDGNNADAATLFGSLSKSCTDCHRVFR